MTAFAPIYEALRAMMIAAAPKAVIASDLPGDLVLHTTDIDPKTGKPVWFGAVSTKRTYVAYHLFPLYSTPQLGHDLSTELSRRRQGKSCFNFTKEEPVLFAELDRLTRKAAEPLG